MLKAIAIASLLMLGACDTLKNASSATSTAIDAANTPITQQQRAAAVNTVLGLKNSYGVALVIADKYVQLPPCKADTLVICSSTSVVRKLAAGQLSVAAGLQRAEIAVLSTTATMSQLDAAILGAKTAYELFQSDVTSTGIK